MRSTSSRHLGRLVIGFASFYYLGPWAWIAMMVGHYKVLSLDQGWAVALSPVTLGLMTFCAAVDIALLLALRHRRTAAFPSFHHYPFLHWAWLGAFGLTCTWLCLRYVLSDLVNTQPSLAYSMIAHGQWLGAGLTFAFFVPLNLHLAEAWEMPQFDYRRFAWVAAFFSSFVGVLFLLKAATVAGEIHPELAIAHQRSTWISILIGTALNVWTLRGFLARQKLLRQENDGAVVTA